MSALMEHDEILEAPAAVRNKHVITEALANVLPKSGILLEIGSGSGLHAVEFAKAFPELTIQPTDRFEAEIASIKAYRGLSGLPNINEPEMFDLHGPDCPVDKADAMIAINVIHISPWETTLALLRHAAATLTPGSPLYLYGPFHRSDVATSQSNLEFDMWLKSKDPSFGIRHLDDVATHAQDLGLSGPQVMEMPANNLSVVFTKI